MSTVEENRRQRLILLEKEYGTQVALAEKIGKSPAQISQWKNASKYSGSEKRRVMDRSTARHIEKMTGKPDGWMDQPATVANKAPTLTVVASNVEAAPELRDTRRIPVVGEVQGGVDGYLEELQYPVGHGEGYVECQSSDSSAFALRVRGDSMHPRYRAGEFIVVEPSIEAQPGDDVVVALKDGRKLLKELNWIRDGEVQLLSVNNHFAPLTLPLSAVLSIQLAAHRVRRNAFHKG